MSIRRALNKLETSAAKSSTELMPHLCRLLGVVDSCLWSPRFTSTSNYHFVMDGQQDYHDSGVSFVLEGSSDASWKASERLRSSLVDCGWATHCDSGKIRVTLRGDCVARQAVGLPTIANEITVHLFEKLGELPEERHGGWVAEATLFGLTDDTDYKTLHTLTELMMPLITNRAVEAVSSTIARVFYRRLLDSLPSVDRPSVEYDASCSDQYTKAFCKTMDARKVATYSGSQIWIPLSATR
jgi:hypothetical protein